MENLEQQMYLSRAEVAEVMGLTTEAVADIERRALRKLRRIILVRYPELAKHVPA